MIEELEKLRNIRFGLRYHFAPSSLFSLEELLTAAGVSGNFPSEEKKVRFVGFYNEFDDVIGKDCVYVHTHESAHMDWLAGRALSHHALMVLSDHQIEGLDCCIVPSTIDVLVKWSRLYWEKLHKGVGATIIAGSIGKTTTKEMIDCVLSASFRSFCTPNNGNVLRYLAYEIQHMPRRVEQFVQEVDESYPNNAADCSYVLQPDIVAITSIGDSHIGMLGGKENVAKAILDSLKFMKQDGTVILNVHDLENISSELPFRTITVGVDDENADCIAKDIAEHDGKMSFTVSYKGEQVPLFLHCSGIHNVYNAMMAFITGKERGMSNSRIRKGLSKYRPMTIRQKLYRWFGKRFYIDCYNASAKSVGSALSVTETIAQETKRKHIAIIGDIAEIDGYEDGVYSTIASEIENSSVDELITYGDKSKSIWRYLNSILPGHHISTEEDLIDYLKHVTRNDIVLLKGSHSMKMEHAFSAAYHKAFILGRIYYWKKLGAWFLKTI